jgi:hypothetical protein
VYGTASEPRTLTMRPSSMLTVRLQVSGQSKVQTLARSSRFPGVRTDVAIPGSWHATRSESWRGAAS